MNNVREYRFHAHSDEYGHLTAVEENREVPFAIKRVYYIFGVRNEVRRGFHSHINLRQMLICVSGSVKILTKTPYEEEITELNDPRQGLYIGPMVWREMYDFSQDAVLLVLASEYYDEADYLRNYQIYERLAKDYLKDGAIK